jgi:hypothetical protein
MAHVVSRQPYAQWLGSPHLPALQLFPSQSAAPPQLLPIAHGSQLPPQSASLSVPSLIPLLQPPAPAFPATPALPAPPVEV